MSQFEFLQTRLDRLAADDRLRQLVPRRIDGAVLESGGMRLHNFGGNDYLGLATRPLHSGAVGSGSSALVCGWTIAHQQLADRIAEFESTESAVLFPSGYAACSGTVATLADEDDLILSDQLNHASLIDGCRLSRAQRVVYPHRDCDFVESTLRDRRDRFQRAWIVTDGVFSMDGHLAPLVALTEIADRYNANLIVDEAHGTGVLGRGGRGVCELLGVKDRVAIRIGTLSKAVGSQGGFVAAPRVVVDYLVNRCRSLVFSTALAPTAVAAAAESLRIIVDEPARREKVCELAKRVRRRLGSEVEPNERPVPIIPVVLGSDARAVAASDHLARLGFYVPAIRPPTVPDGTARLRVSLSASHQGEVVDQLCEEINQLR